MPSLIWRKSPGQDKIFQKEIIEEYFYNPLKKTAIPNNDETCDEKHSKSHHRRYSAEEEKKRDFEMFFQGMKYQHTSDCRWINMNAAAMHYGLYGKYPAMQQQEEKGSKQAMRKDIGLRSDHLKLDSLSSTTAEDIQAAFKPEYEQSKHAIYAKSSQIRQQLKEVKQDLKQMLKSEQTVTGQALESEQILDNQLSFSEPSIESQEVPSSSDDLKLNSDSALSSTTEVVQTSFKPEYEQSKHAIYTKSADIRQQLKDVKQELKQMLICEQTSANPPPTSKPSLESMKSPSNSDLKLDSDSAITKNVQDTLLKPELQSKHAIYAKSAKIRQQLKEVKQDLKQMLKSEQTVTDQTSKADTVAKSKETTPTLPQKISQQNQFVPPFWYPNQASFPQKQHHQLYHQYPPQGQQQPQQASFAQQYHQYPPQGKQPQQHQQQFSPFWYQYPQQQHFPQYSPQYYQQQYKPTPYSPWSMSYQSSQFQQGPQMTLNPSSQSQTFSASNKPSPTSHYQAFPPSQQQPSSLFYNQQPTPGRPTMPFHPISPSSSTTSPLVSSNPSQIPQNVSQNSLPYMASTASFPSTTSPLPVVSATPQNASSVMASQASLPTPSRIPPTTPTLFSPNLSTSSIASFSSTPTSLPTEPSQSLQSLSSSLPTASASILPTQLHGAPSLSTTSKSLSPSPVDAGEVSAKRNSGDASQSGDNLTNPKHNFADPCKFIDNSADVYPSRDVFSDPKDNFNNACRSNEDLV